MAVPQLMPYGHPPLEALAWIASSDVGMHGFAETNRPGAIDVLPSGGGGAAFDDLDELPQWFTSRLRAADLAENIFKLLETEREELHLFLRIYDTSMPFSLYYPLAWGSSIPPRPLDPPPGLTGLWLATAWKNPILWWSSATGWARVDCLD